MQYIVSRSIKNVKWRSACAVNTRIRVIVTADLEARAGVPPVSIRAPKLMLPPTLLARAGVPPVSIRALEFVLPPTLLARGRVGFIVPLYPRHGAQGAARADLK